MKTVSIHIAKRILPQLLARVEAGEELVPYAARIRLPRSCRSSLSKGEGSLERCAEKSRSGRSFSIHCQSKN